LLPHIVRVLGGTIVMKLCGASSFRL